MASEDSPCLGRGPAGGLRMVPVGVDGWPASPASFLAPNAEQGGAAQPHRQLPKACQGLCLSEVSSNTAVGVVGSGGP